MNIKSNQNVSRTLGTYIVLPSNRSKVQPESLTLIKITAIYLRSVSAICHQQGCNRDEFCHISPVRENICYLGGEQDTQDEDEANGGVKQIRQPKFARGWRPRAQEADNH